MDSEIKSRIIEIINSSGGNHSQFARSIGITPGNLAVVLSSEDKGVSASMLRGITALGVNMEWLFKGAGEMFATPESDANHEAIKLKLVKCEEKLSKLAFYVEQLERLNRERG